MKPRQPNTKMQVPTPAEAILKDEMVCGNLTSLSERFVFISMNMESI
jgi:hypothetical protein